MGIKTQNPFARLLIIALITFLVAVFVWLCGVGMFRLADKYSKPVPGRPSPSTFNR